MAHRFGVAPLAALADAPTFGWGCWDLSADLDVSGAVGGSGCDYTSSTGLSSRLWAMPPPSTAFHFPRMPAGPSHKGGLTWVTASCQNSTCMAVGRWGCSCSCLLEETPRRGWTSGQCDARAHDRPIAWLRHQLRRNVGCRGVRSSCEGHARAVGGAPRGRRARQ